MKFTKNEAENIRQFTGQEQKDVIPLLFVDVNLGHGNKPRIALFEGDKPEEVAATFARIQSNDNFLWLKLYLQIWTDTCRRNLKEC